MNKMNALEALKLGNKSKFKVWVMELYFLVPVGADGNGSKRKDLDNEC